MNRYKDLTRSHATFSSFAFISASSDQFFESLHQLRLVALDSPRSGELHGVLGVDYQCIREAAQNKFVGSFRGFLAPPHSGREGQNLESIVRHQEWDLPIVNARGQPLFPSWKSIFEDSGALGENARHGIFSFSGKNVIKDPHWYALHPSMPNFCQS